MSQLIRCACGKHYISVDSEKTVRWESALWNPKCAFLELKARWDLLHAQHAHLFGQRMKWKHVMEKIGDMHCDLCDQPLGRHPHFYGTGLYHASCLHDIGGEG